MLVPLSKMVILTRFIPRPIVECSDLQQMRTNYLINELKPQGVIVRRSEQRRRMQQPRTLSLQHPMSDYATIASNDSIKVPGQIRKFKVLAKVDQQVYYNADLFKVQPKLQQTMAYQESQSLLPVKRDAPEAKMLGASNNSRIIDGLESIKEENHPIYLDNIHGRFDIQKYNETYIILSNILSSLWISQYQLSVALEVYANKTMLTNITEIDDIKLAYSKKDLLKQSFIKEREAIIIVCLTIVVGKLQNMKNYCSNLLKFVFQNYLVSLNILAENSGHVYYLMKQSGKEHLHGKGFEFLRSNNQIINDLMVKIIRVDPLFAQEYYKIKENHPAPTVGPFLLTMLSFFAFYLNASKAESIVPYFAVAPQPFVTEANSQQYTLVIDFMRVFLDQSSRKKKNRLNRDSSFRPYSSYFLKQMSKYYEIISFCESMPMECNKVINAVDEQGIVKHRLFKFHIDTTIKRKEVTKIGRSLDKIILLDTFPNQQSQNLFQLNSWKGQSSDAQLAEICPLLAQIAVKKLSARSSLKKIQEAVSQNSSLGLKYINCGLTL